MAGVLFSPEAARRIVSATRTVERMGTAPDADGWYPHVPDEPTEVHKLGKTAALWAKGSAAQITVHTGTPLAEAAAATPEVLTAYNKFADVPSGKWVMLGKYGANWYLIAAEC